jgi:hypothetical protein
MQRFLIRYVLDDGHRAQLHAIAASTFDALDQVQLLFGVRLRYATAARAAH